MAGPTGEEEGTNWVHGWEAQLAHILAVSRNLSYAERVPEATWRGRHGPGRDWLRHAAPPRLLSAEEVPLQLLWLFNMSKYVAFGQRADSLARFSNGPYLGSSLLLLICASYAKQLDVVRAEHSHASAPCRERGVPGYLAAAQHEMIHLDLGFPNTFGAMRVVQTPNLSVTLD